ncbi:N-acetylmuramoyl-L-alanine amidase [Candidatus Ishikawella capsulata]|uniref:N-acetylmuramoyl-L-alanine amidase n=1 Tax=Candidatus Ishikawaella capsulata Mpkobe TaxID=476281 RepID=C5WCI4_9ENTR|nr:N-acetylmuramoyl-L-alanine amidase [Candidatus Ishikawaella capsulata]BAH83040.1 N-acetylmuramoyl-l-alanine amidase II [Candidatus Ishikawaella capsulata Mpkobe]
MILRISYKYIGLIYLLTGLTCAADPCHIQVVNTSTDARIILRFNKNPDYTYVFRNYNKELILNINNIDVSKIFELNFNKDNYIKSIQYFNDDSDHYKNKLIFEFPYNTKVTVSKKITNSKKNIILNVAKTMPDPIYDDDQTSYDDLLKKNNFLCKTNIDKKITIALDPGHGGGDPGAIGQNGLYEKTINFKIACKLQKLLNNNPMFDCFLIRDKDERVHLDQRKDIARQRHANILISIHANSIHNPLIHGASTWILSHDRFITEINNWVGSHPQNLQSLAEIGPVFNCKMDDILRKVILDVEYHYWNHISMAVSIKILKKLKDLYKITYFKEMKILDNVLKLDKKTTQRAGFSVLCSPDIPSVIIETGFLSYTSEASLLSTDAYQNQLAESIYHGMVNYFCKNSYPEISTTTKLLSLHTNNASINHNKEYVVEDMKYLVKEGDTLYSISKKYGVSTPLLSDLNHLNSNTISVGNFLTITSNKK